MYGHMNVKFEDLWILYGSRNGKSAGTEHHYVARLENDPAPHSPSFYCTPPDTSCVTDI